MSYTANNQRGVDRYVGRDDPAEPARLEAQREGVQDELARALALVALPETPRVLEIGCGSGVLTAALVQVLPTALITAVDLNDALLAEARARLGGAAALGSRVRLEHADAAALPYRERLFDLVTCRYVLMHQNDPMLMAGEMYRVTALGGYALAFEPDWGARAVYPDAEAYAELLYLARRARPHGFPDLLIGRKLFALLRAAGYGPVHIRATAFSATADARATDLSALPSGPERLLEQGRPLLRRAGIIDDASLDDLIARLAALQRSQDYCSTGVDLAAVAEKRAPRLQPPPDGPTRTM
jgi:SAM-dependent methyltransferase